MNLNAYCVVRGPKEKKIDLSTMMTNDTDDIVIENDDPSNIIENENKNQYEVAIDYEVIETLEGFNETNNEEEEQNNDVDEVPELVDDAELNKSKSNIEKVVQADNTLKFRYQRILSDYVLVMNQ